MLKIDKMYKMQTLKKRIKGKMLVELRGGG